MAEEKTVNFSNGKRKKRLKGEEGVEDVLQRKHIAIVNVIS